MDICYWSSINAIRIGSGSSGGERKSSLLVFPWSWSSDSYQVKFALTFRATCHNENTPKNMWLAHLYLPVSDIFGYQF